MKLLKYDRGQQKEKQVNKVQFTSIISFILIPREHVFSQRLSTTLTFLNNRDIPSHQKKKRDIPFPHVKFQVSYHINLIAKAKLHSNKCDQEQYTLATTTFKMFSNEPFCMGWVLISDICSKTLMVGEVYPCTISSNDKQAP